MCVTAGISINVPHFIICHSKCSSICNCLSRGAGDSQSTYHLLSFQSHIRISYLPHYWPGQPANSSTKHFINMRIFGPNVDHEDRNSFQSTPTLHCGWPGGHISHFVLPPHNRSLCSAMICIVSVSESHLPALDGCETQSQAQISFLTTDFDGWEDKMFGKTIYFALLTSQQSEEIIEEWEEPRYLA